jgi:hypothetical protein
MNTIKSTVKCVGSCAMAPIYKFGGSMYKGAAVRLAVASPAFTAEYEKHQAAGTDMAAAATADFLALQTQLYWYRVARVRDEWRALTAADGGESPLAPKNWSFKGFLVELRFATRLVFVFMLTYVLARQSVYPLLKPGSPFLEQKKYMNPNY